MTKSVATERRIRRSPGLAVVAGPGLGWVARLKGFEPLTF